MQLPHQQRLVFSSRSCRCTSKKTIKKKGEPLPFAIERRGFLFLSLFQRVFFLLRFVVYFLLRLASAARPTSYFMSDNENHNDEEEEEERRRRNKSTSVVFLPRSIVGGKKWRRMRPARRATSETRATVALEPLRGIPFGRWYSGGPFGFPLVSFQ